MYIPRAISFKKKNFVALESADSLSSSHVFGLGCLKPLGHADCVDPPVVKYSGVWAEAATAGLASLAEVTRPRWDILEANESMLFVVFVGLGEKVGVVDVGGRSFFPGT